MKYLFVILSLLLISCTQELVREDALMDLENISGIWHDEKLGFYERWQKLDDSTFIGTGYSLKDKDTAFIEHLLIRQEGTRIFYQAQVSKQNDGKPVRFPLVKSTPTLFVFENLEHDYPNRIIYLLKSDTSMQARTENKRGKRRLEFNFRKINR